MPSLRDRVRSSVGDVFGAGIVEARLEKAVREAAARASEPSSMFYDPLSMLLGDGWLRRPNQAITARDLRRMAKNPIVAAIIQTRINQIASFCQPQQGAYDYGFRIVSDDEQAKKDSARIDELTQWVYTAGLPGYGEKSLEAFARKFMRNSLVLDQCAAEVVFARNGTPAYFVAVDAATIFRTEASLFYGPPEPDTPAFCQVVNGVVETEDLAEQIMFGVRNEQTDMSYVGYGAPELETLVRTVTTLLNAEKLNSGQLSSGGTAKGVFLVKGDTPKDQFESFKRDFREAIRNAATYWKPPVLQTAKDANVEWLELDRSNRDMEYSALFDFLVKQACGVYQVDPNEINWSIGQTGANITFEGRQKDKVDASQMRGLKPLLGFLASHITHGCIQKLDPRYRLEFVGLNTDREADTRNRVQEVQNYKTIDEVRQEMGLAKLKGTAAPLGDLILNPFFIQKLDELNQAKAQKEQDAQDLANYQDLMGPGDEGDA